MEPVASPAGNEEEQEFRFPPVTREHILHCSYDYWFPKYRSNCIRSRIIPLTPEFVSYIREDGIILADEDEFDNDDEDDDDWEPTNPSSTTPAPERIPEDEGDYSESDSDSDSEQATAPAKLPPNRRFPDLHKAINDAIAALGGAAAPKLNWSSPKDATWISRHPNTVKCTSANDVYILLKSSSFVSHDLDHAFDDTIAPTASSSITPLQPVLVLRSFFNPLPSLEFRCFVKDRSLVAITQRDLNYYAFLRSLRPAVIARCQELFKKLRLTFPDPSFVFDVYIPEADYNSDDDDSDNEITRSRLGRARLIDINPWALKTDSLLFDWRELIDMKVARPLIGSADSSNSKDELTSKVVRLRISTNGQSSEADKTGADEEEDTDDGLSSGDDFDDEDEEETEPELRLVEKDDPAAYNFCSPKYSAHKLPKDVVDASMAGEGGLREFARRWQRLTEGRG